jgi:hypothetical protein
MSNLRILAIAIVLLSACAAFDQQNIGCFSDQETSNWKKSKPSGELEKQLVSAINSFYLEPLPEKGIRPINGDHIRRYSWYLAADGDYFVCAARVTPWTRHEQGCGADRLKISTGSQGYEVESLSFVLCTD